MLFRSENRAAGQKFMNAYIRASRVYNDSLANGKFAGALGDKVIEILAKHTGQTNLQLIRDATPHGLNPDGGVLIPSLRKDFDFFRERGLIETDVKFENVIDNAFAETAAKALGPYKKA